MSEKSSDSGDLVIVLTNGGRWAVKSVKDGYRIEKPNPDAPLSLDELERLNELITLAIATERRRIAERDLKLDHQI